MKSDKGGDTGSECKQYYRKNWPDRKRGNSEKKESKEKEDKIEGEYETKKQRHDGNYPDALLIVLCLEFSSFVRSNRLSRPIEKRSDCLRVFSFVYKRTYTLFDKITRKHIGDIPLEPISRDDANFLFLGRDNEEYSIVFLFLSNLVALKNAHSNIEKLISVSVRYEDYHHLIGRLCLIVARHFSETRKVVGGEGIRKIFHVFDKFWERHRINGRSRGSENRESETKNKKYEKFREEF